MEFETTVLEAEDKAFEEFLHNQIRAFNNENSPLHRAACQPGAIRSLNLVLTDGSGAMVGGLAATVYWDWLEIENFFVPAEARGQGLGAKLLRQAECMAAERGCAHVHLTTYEFQARTFYEKQGYRVVGTLEDYPPGSAYYWMRKDL